MHFSKLWNCKIPHRLHMIHPALFSPPSQSLFCPIFFGKQLFTQTAASAIHRSREAIKKSSQCCVSVDPFLFLHVIPSYTYTLMHTHQLALRHVHTHTHSWTLSSRVWWCQDSLFFFFWRQTPQIAVAWHCWIWGIIEARAERSHVISKIYWPTDFFHIFFSGGMRPHKVWLASRWHLES